jgi:ribosomal protein L29
MASALDLEDKDLVHQVLAKERTLVANRFSHSMNALENTASLRHLKKDIARLRTEARSREIKRGLAKDSLLHEHRQTFGDSSAMEDTEVQEKGGFLSGIVDKLAGKE